MAREALQLVRPRMVTGADDEIRRGSQSAIDVRRSRALSGTASSRPAFVATFLSRFAPLTPVIGRIAQLWRSLLVVLME
jgi:hypothetical protein